jgi:DNA helicase-2/ATP-dependent DNA helicase PcrA
MRIIDEVGDLRWRLFAGTFHAFSLEVLQNYGSRIGVPPNVSILDSDEDRLETLRRGLEDQGLVVDERPNSNPLRDVLSAIDRLRLDLVPVEAAPSTTTSVPNLSLNEAFGAYESQLDAYGALDFPGILFRAYQLLTTDAWVADHYRETYPHVLVDEAQDLNLAQYEIVRTLCSEHHDVMFVADRHQSIYAFTGASPKFVDRFIADYKPDVMHLTTNFRSAASIVAVANNLASHFTNGAQPPQMSSAAGAEGSVEGWEFTDEVREAVGVVEWLQGLITSGLDPKWIHVGEDPRVLPEDCCVLARTRFALEPIADRLSKLKIPYAMRTGERGLFDSKLGAAIYYCLRIISNGRDLPSYRRLGKLMKTPALTPDQLEVDRGAFVAWLGEHDDRDLPGIVAARLQALAAGTESIGPLVEWLSAVVISGFDTTETDAAVQWLGDQKHMRDLWQRFALQTSTSERDLAGFVRYLAQSQRVTLDEPGIRILTVHTAKGLEFKAVALVGMNDGTFPHYLSLRSDEELEEERRNAYVAVTRAARVLRLTRATARSTRYGARQDPPSRFLAQMGISLTRKGSSVDLPF